MSLLERVNNSKYFVFLVGALGIIGGLLAIWDVVIKPLYDKPNTGTMQEHYLQNWTTPAGIIILVIVLLIILKRFSFLSNQYEEVNNYARGLVNVIDRMITDNNEKQKSKWMLDLATVHAGIVNTTIENNKHFNEGINSLDKRFNHLNSDFASFAHYYQGIIAIAGGDYPGAYFNFVHSIKGSIESNNLKNIPRVFDNLKEQVLPYLCSSDINSMKKNKMLDIEDAFKHIITADKDKTLELGILKVREMVNGLPETRPVPQIADINPDTTFVELQTNKGRAKLNLTAIKQVIS